MVPGQDWCLHCGAGAPAALHPRPSWRSLISVAVVALLLAVGAAAAAYAALNEKAPPRKTVVAITPPVSSTPTTTVPAIPSTPQSTSTPSIPSEPSTLPEPSAPPKIPLSTPTPSTPSKTTNTTSKESTKTSTQGKTETGSSETGSSSTKEVAPIVLDTNAAATYNPNNYPATDFGEPELAIDGDPSTAWTAAVQPETAPQMAAGLLIDLKTPRKLSKFELISPSKGMTIEVYGTEATAPPASITETPATTTEKGWVKIVRARVIKKAKTKIILRKPSKAFRYVLLWLIKAPPNSTPTEPGQVKVDELTLFPVS